MIYIIFFTYLFFTAWLNAKFIKDSNASDQYWHWVQFYQQIYVYISYGIILLIFGVSLKNIFYEYLIPLVGFALMYSFLYNTLLNIMRKIKITHVSRYDFFTFKQTVILFFIGLFIIIINELK